ncbi:MAG: phosphoribosylformylglycinamidine synthase subunit PurQ [Chloroflexi bacterium]|nr:phosphoribosylformylglycinamidine synthase subunit PurQ [Chloroflexota bacterium]
MKFGVIVFPGTNCDRDTYHVIDTVFGQPVEYIWHEDTDLSPYDCILLPGGFAYGDYLRAGAIARFSPVMRSVERFARGDGLVLGICNGFQVLLEAGLLPGAMLRNDHLQFRCSWVHVRVESTDSPFTSACETGQVLKLPIAHQEGSYYAPEDLLEQLERRSQILLRYCDPDGRVTRESNPNGSLWNVAGLCNEGRNVFGLMPHPERCCEAILGGTDGSYVFRSILGLKPVGSALTPTLSQRERGSTQHSGLRTQNTEPTREHN